LDRDGGQSWAGAWGAPATWRGCGLWLPQQVEEVPGQGIRGLADGHRVAVGKAGWVGVTGQPAWVKAARRRARLDGALTVFVAVDGVPAGVLILDDPLRPDAARTIRALRDSGISRIVMVTGDRAEVADAARTGIGAAEVLAERTPADKLAAVGLERDRAPTIMVGDGINDAPALALADVGVAMGARGSGASSEAADAVLTVDRLDRLGEVRTVARRTRRIARQSVLAGMAMSLAAMAGGGRGLLPPVWGAVVRGGVGGKGGRHAPRGPRPPPPAARPAAPAPRPAARPPGRYRHRADQAIHPRTPDDPGRHRPAAGSSGRPWRPPARRGDGPCPPGLPAAGGGGGAARAGGAGGALPGDGPPP